MKPKRLALPLKGRLLEILLLLEKHEELCRPDMMALMRGKPSVAGVGVTLHRMDKDGWLFSRLEDRPSGRHRRKRFYRLSEKGKSVLELHQAYETFSVVFEKAVEDASKEFLRSVRESIERSYDKDKEEERPN